VTIAQYRLLLIAFLVVGIAGGALDLVFPALLPEEFQVAQKHLDDELSNGRTFIFTIVGVCTVAFGIASIHGLYRFRPWAPRSALVTTVLAVLVWPIGGAFAQSGAAVGLNFLASYLWGAAVVLAHLPPLNSMFERRDG
jgi:MFS family permease